MVEGDTVLKMGFRIPIASKMTCQNNEVEWQHLMARGKVDIMSLLSRKDKLVKIFDRER